MHTCDTPLCCNPRHLRLGTQAENIADMIAKGRALRARGEGAAHLLTEEQVREIRAMRGKLSGAAIGRRYGVSETTVYDIFNGRSWAWLDTRPGSGS